MMKKLFYVLIASFALSTTSYAQGVYDFPVDKHDFGVIDEGTIATFEFKFTNTGKDSLNLKRENIRPSCGCTTPKVTEGRIAPGSQGVITAEYNSAGRIGPFTKTIHVFDSTAIVKVLTIKGIVVKKEEVPTLTDAQLKKSPKATFDKTENSFGKIERGQMVTCKFNLKNTGKDTLKITSAQSACGCINYKLYSKDNAPINYVLPGKSAIVEVTYNPQGTGINRDIVTLFTNDLATPRIALTLKADVVESLIEKSPVKSDEIGSPFQK
ncbi:MAG: DUF1573 domain-containing protein [Cytophagaceae bacterium]|nr:DUF1573 domain-containing protein [Cytophagaceae bacterium]